MTENGLRENEPKGVIVLGSARSDGHTGQVAAEFARESGFALIDLNDLDIGYFDYNMPDRDDDFLPLMQRLVGYDLIVFATPVYWYSMSAIMKTFFDRLTDLLKWHKDLGSRLRGKSMAMMSCGSHDRIERASFSHPFESSARYLGMHYLGAVHTWVGKSGMTEDMSGRIRTFAKDLRTALSDVRDY